MLTPFTKLCFNIFAAGHLLLLPQCGVNLPPKSRHSQSGPHQNYLVGQEVPLSSTPNSQQSSTNPTSDNEDDAGEDKNKDKNKDEKKEKNKSQ